MVTRSLPSCITGMLESLSKGSCMMEWKHNYLHHAHGKDMLGVIVDGCLRKDFECFSTRRGLVDLLRCDKWVT
jgi:hypothetical protein